MAAFIWDGYQLAQYKNDSILLAVLVGVSAILGLVMFLIGEVTWENLDYPFGLPDGEQSKPKWQKLLGILSILFWGWLLFDLLLKPPKSAYVLDTINDPILVFRDLK